MNRTVISLVLVVAATMILGDPSSAMAQTVTTPYHGLSTFVADADLGRQWVSDGILHIRNSRQIWFDDADDPRVRGDVTLTINANFHLVPLPVFGHGPMWGALRIENDGGSWIGTWFGQRTIQGHSFVRLVLKGVGGYDGLHARAEYMRRSPDPTKPFDFAGVIIQTPAN